MGFVVQVELHMSLVCFDILDPSGGASFGTTRGTKVSISVRLQLFGVTHPDGSHWVLLRDPFFIFALIFRHKDLGIG